MGGREGMRRQKGFPWTAAALAAAGAVMMLYGISRGEMAVVLMKAIHICLECVGIG